MIWIEEIIKTILQNGHITTGILIIAIGILIYLIFCGLAKIANALKQKTF